MGKSIISEGKTTSEAIQKGLNELKVSKRDVDIKVLEEDNKKSFFNILAPRIVKVEITVKDDINNNNKNKENKVTEEDFISEEEFKKIENNLNKFIEAFFEKININNVNYNIINEKNDVKVDINGDNLNNLIGYRGETLNSIQIILNRIGNKGLNLRHRIIVDIAGYREKRVKALEDLAVKVSKTAEKKGKSITLEPMTAFERKIIHNKLQENSKVTTHSIGKEPNRRIVIELKK